MGMRNLPREDDGSYPFHVWPGGYPLMYIADDGASICPVCANSEGFHEGGANDGFRLDGYFQHLEGPPEICASCNGATASAYSEKCKFCGGSGEIEGIGGREIVCDKCDGAGWV